MEILYTVWWLVFCTNVDRPWHQVFVQTLLWMLLWGYYFRGTKVSLDISPTTAFLLMIIACPGAQYSVNSKEHKIGKAYDSQDTETNFMSFSGRIVKENVVSIHDRLLFAHKKNTKTPWFPACVKLGAVKRNEVTGHREMGLCGSLMENSRKSIDVIAVGSGMVVTGDWEREGRDKGIQLIHGDWVR